MRSADQYAQMAEDETKRGGNQHNGQIFALLAIAAALKEGPVKPATQGRRSPTLSPTARAMTGYPPRPYDPGRHD